MDNRYISWDLIPPERHFQSPEELKNEFNLYSSMGLEPWELHPMMRPPENKFEIITHETEEGLKKYLWPTSHSYLYLFRGQEMFYENCVPTLYRNGDVTSFDLFVNQIRLEEFKLMALQYPLVNFFQRKGYEVDFKGLAQHYGLGTDVLDLTSSIDIALFFAMCSYDKSTGNYIPKSDSSKEYIGYLYAYPFFSLMSLPQMSRKPSKVMPIGLQPFKRPGAQRGFALHLQKDESLVAPLYSFSYTSADSQQIYEKYKDIFVEDELAKLTRGIAQSDTLFIDAVKKVCSQQSIQIFGKYLSYGEAAKLLKAHHFNLTATPEWRFSKDKLEELSKKQNSDIESLSYSIVQRKVIVGGKEYPYMDYNFLCSREMTSAFKIGCPSLTGYNSGFALGAEKEGIVSMMEFDMGRKQTIPNKETGKVDFWDNLPWENYEKPNPDNRFQGYYPKPELVWVPRKK